jgi:long-chain acyl-CoA synthetase
MCQTQVVNSVNSAAETGTFNEGAFKEVVTVADFLANSALRDPDRVALIEAETGVRISYSALDSQVSATASALLESGLIPSRMGDRVAMLMGNSIEFVVSYFGIIRAGLVPIPLNPGYTSREITEILEISQAKVLLVSAEFAELGAESVPDTCPAVLCEEITSARESIRNFVKDSIKNLIRKSEAKVVFPEIASDDLGLLLFTSGSDGTAKGVMLTNANLVSNVNALVGLRNPPIVSAEDTVLAVLPLFHVYGLNTVLTMTIAAGASVVILDRFDASESLEIISREHVTTIAGAPAMYLMWSRIPNVANAMRPIRLLSSGGAPLPTDVFNRFEQLTGMRIFEGYGMTETSPVITSTVVDSRARAGCVGIPIQGTSIRIMADSGEDAELGDPGEIWVKGPGVFLGYWPDRDGGPDSQGWFGTGDIGYQDEDGALHLVDRRRELIIVNGFNVFPREVEVALEALPDISEAAVLGRPDAETGEAVSALIVLAPGSQATEESISATVALSLARFKCPTQIRVVRSLPRSATGKIAKGRLREVYGVGVDGVGVE